MKGWRLTVVAGVGCLVLVGCSGLGAVQRAGSSGDPNSAAVGVTLYAAGNRPSVPDLAGTTLQGKAFALSQLTAGVTVINAWASWCEPCRAESPELAALAKKLEPSVHFIGLDESDSHAAAVKFAAKVGAAYPELSDTDGTLLASLKLLPTKGIPSTLILDRQHRVAGRIVGPMTAAVLSGVIDAARSG
jgi:thiol-disulfide isomerase/thioredoxin